MKESIKNLIKAVSVTAVMLGGGSEIKSQQIPEPKRIEQGKQFNKLESPRLAEMPDGNMSDGFDRKHLYAKLDGKETNIGSAFYIEPGIAKARFISNDKHPDCISGTPNYENVEKLMKQNGEELVMAFPAAYRSPSGNIEGIAYENGESVGETTYGPWKGFVYMNQGGELEMYRMKDEQGNFNQAGADALVAKAKRDKGSLYQQIPAIWNGTQRLFANPIDPNTKDSTFEWRAICETKTGEKFVINCSAQVTESMFLKMCVDLKDEQGNPAIYNMMMNDTGQCSYAIFRDKNQIESDEKTGKFTSYLMIDEDIRQELFTNILVLSK